MAESQKHVIEQKTANAKKKKNYVCTYVKT